MLGLETDDGKSAEVEIDSLETDDLQPEDIPKGRVRKTSIVEKLSKSKESELIALSLMESAGQRQREFEKLISEHQELVQEISRTPSAENIVQIYTRQTQHFCSLCRLSANVFYILQTPLIGTL
ncbi:hypothetical protein Btru_022629 [Bulinus truncatus]|nr:hypothetical protein Btru_022629 [Bulinus truncatus]